jgi:hypothetical protein
MFKKKEKIEKWDCEKQGHDYEVVYYLAAYASDLGGGRALWPTIHIECRHCNKRESIIGNLGEIGTGDIIRLWKNKDISNEQLKIFSAFMVDNWIRMTEKTKKPVKKTKTKGGK